jgi:hypothetical protein
MLPLLAATSGDSIQRHDRPLHRYVSEGRPDLRTTTDFVAVSGEPGLVASIADMMLLFAVKISRQASRC